MPSRCWSDLIMPRGRTHSFRSPHCPAGRFSVATGKALEGTGRHWKALGGTGRHSYWLLKGLLLQGTGRHQKRLLLHRYWKASPRPKSPLKASSRSPRPEWPRREPLRRESPRTRIATTRIATNERAVLSYWLVRGGIRSRKNKGMANIQKAGFIRPLN